MDEWIADHRASELPQPPKLGGWQFLGSFTGKNKDAAFKKDWGPEKKVDLAKEHDGKKMGAARVWGRQGAHRRHPGEQRGLFLSHRDVGQGAGGDGVARQR